MTTALDTPPNSKLRSDAPAIIHTIGKNQSNDIFGWGNLTETITEAIQNRIPESGYTVGITGPWGSGKTTILDDVRALIKSEEEQDLIAVTYSPWLVPGSDHLLELLDAIHAELGEASQRKLKRQVRRYRRRLRVFRAFGRTPSGLARIAPTLAVLLTVGLTEAGVVLSATTFRWIVTVLLCLQATILLGEWALSIIEGMADARQLTLSELKSKLSATLHDKPERRIVVFVDDIDRLPPEDICALFQLVKNNMDIPGMVFVLAFDTSIIRSALVDKYSAQYAQFDEKIVQLEFPVPKPDPARLDDFFLQEIKVILEDLPRKSREGFDESDFLNTHDRYLRHMYSTVRDVKRIVNGISVCLDLMCTKDTLEVHLTDFLALEMLRVQLPRVREFIWDNQGWLAQWPNDEDFLGLEKQDAAKFRAEYKDLISDIRPNTLRTKIDGLLKQLFPRLPALFDELPSGSHDVDELAAELRVGSHKAFWRYFIYGNYIGDIPESLLSDIVLYMSNRSTESPLVPFHHKPYVVQILEALTIKAEQFLKRPVTPNQALEFALESAEHLPFFGASGNDIPPHTKLMWFVERIFGFVPDDHKSKTLRSVVKSCRSVLGVAVISRSYADYEVYKDHWDSEDQKFLRDTCETRLERWLTSEHPFEQLNTRFLLGVMTWLTDADTVQSHVRTVLDHEGNFRQFVRLFVKNVGTRKYGDKYSKAKLKFDFTGLKQFADPKSVYEKSRGVSLSDTDNDIVQTAFELLQRDYPVWSKNPQNYDRGWT